MDPHTHGNGNMIFSCEDPHMDLHMGISIWGPHRGKSYSYSQHNSMGMGIHIQGRREGGGSRVVTRDPGPKEAESREENPSD